MTISNRRRGNTTQTMSINIEDTQTLAKYYEKNVDDRYCDSKFEGRESLNGKIRFYVGDITQFNVDAIVCPVQTDLSLVPYGIHKQVLEKAGPLYQEKCQQVSECEAGETFVTKGFNLDAKYVIHAAGLPPKTRCGQPEKIEVLKDSYKSCLDQVSKNEDIQSVAFPCLGCGGGGIELAEAINVAVTMIRNWIETGDNLNLIDCIILVMFNDNQKEEYTKQLTRAFPYGKDLAGIDLESLESVPQSHLEKLEPREATSTHILCFRHKKKAQKDISRHFHSLVNTLHKKICAQNEPVERFKTCASFKVCASHHHHGIILYHGLKSHTIEVKVISYSPNVNDLCLTLCERIQTFVENYLVEHLDNSSTFKACIRCERSSFGDKKGYIFTQELYEHLQKNATYPCKHRTSGIHLAYPEKLLKHWTHSTLSSIPHQRQPVENDEMTYAASRTDRQSTWQPLQPDSIVGSTPNIPGEMPQCPGIAEPPQSYQPFTPSLLNDGPNQFLTELKTTNNATNHNRERKSWKTPGSEVTVDHQAISCNFSNMLETSDASAVQRQQSTSLPVDQTQNLDPRQSNSCPAVCDNDSTKRKTQGRHGSSSSVQSDFDSMGACGETTIGYVSEFETMYSDNADKLNDRKLVKIARVIGNKEDQLGLELGLPFSSVQRIKSEHPGDVVMQAFHILHTWKIQQRGQASMETLMEAMTECGIDTSFL